MPWLIVCSAMIGKLAITSSYGAIYVFTAEQFPTVIRNVGLGASSTFARIGGVMAPYVNHLVCYLSRYFVNIQIYIETSEVNISPTSHYMKSSMYHIISNRFSLKYGCHYHWLYLDLAPYLVD